MINKSLQKKNENILENNDIFITDSKDLSNKNNTLNRKIFSIINSSGTEEDESSGINIVLQDVNYISNNDIKTNYKGYEIINNQQTKDDRNNKIINIKKYNEEKVESKKINFN